MKTRSAVNIPTKRITVLYCLRLTISIPHIKLFSFRKIEDKNLDIRANLLGFSIAIIRIIPTANKTGDIIANINIIKKYLIMKLERASNLALL